MKILMIFIDMLRPNMLNTWDASNKISKIDNRMRNWGGTIYTKCYTPAPDTPRSMGCLWSGNYPKINGCDLRLKYPAYFFNRPEDNFLSVLRDNGYHLHFAMGKTNYYMGELPFICDDLDVSMSRNSKSYLQGLKLEENSLTMIISDDYHTIINDGGATPKMIDEGNRVSDSIFEFVENKFGVDIFDLIICFSDHGCALDDELHRMRNDGLVQLGDGRDQIFMYLRRKGDSELTQNNKLCSIMDVGATICEYAGVNIPYAQEGKSLLTCEESEYILVEDHRTFGVSLGVPIEYWGIRTRDNLAVINLEKVWQSEKEISEQEKCSFEEIIREKGTDYIMNTEINYVLKKYKEFENEPFTTYFDGTARYRKSLGMRFKVSFTSVIRNAIKHYMRL